MMLTNNYCDCLFPFLHPRKHLRDPRDLEFDGKVFKNWRGSNYGDNSPRTILRGIFHEFMAIMYPFVIYFMFSNSSGTLSSYVHGGIFCFTGFLLYLVSSQFHRRNFSNETHLFMRRLDHACIFLKCSGISSLVSILMIKGYIGQNGDFGLFIHLSGIVIFVLSWWLTVIGVSYSFEKKLSKNKVDNYDIFLMVVSGGLLFPFAYQCFTVMTQLEFVSLAMSWTLFGLGILIYNTRSFDIHKEVFGFHEVFHLTTVIGDIFITYCCISICSRLK